MGGQNILVTTQAPGAQQLPNPQTAAGITLVANNDPTYSIDLCDQNDFPPYYTFTLGAGQQTNWTGGESLYARITPGQAGVTGIAVWVQPGAPAAAQQKVAVTDVNATQLQGIDVIAGLAGPSNPVLYYNTTNGDIESEVLPAPSLGTTFQNFLSGTFAPTGTPQNVPSCSVDLVSAAYPSTWLVTGFVEGGGSVGSYWWLTTTSAGAATTGFTGGDVPANVGGYPVGSSKTYSLTISGPTTVYMVAAGSSGSQLDGSNLLSTPNATGLVAVQTA